MIRKERRHNFFINKPLQLRYMGILTAILLVILLVSLASAYFGIWGEVLNAFSDEKIQNDLLTASRLQQYDEARHARASGQGFSALSFFTQAERLSDRQQEIFKEILNQTHQNLGVKLLLLLALVAAGSLFISHKVAGPLYRFEHVLQQIREGDLTVRCHLRKFDEARSVAHSFNLTLESLNERVSRLEKIVRENEKNPERLLSLLREELSHFKTSADR